MNLGYLITGMVVMSLTTYLIRVTPMVVFRKKITNRFVRSFLYYVPYVTLSVMTFPAMMEATNSQWSGLAAFVAAVALAWRGFSLFNVAVAACVLVFVIELAI